MNEREGFEAQQEGKRGTAGSPSRETREHLWQGLVMYLSAEARHARKVAASERDAGPHPER